MPVGSERVRIFVQSAKRKTSAHNFGFIFFILAYPFQYFSLHILSHCRHKIKIPGICKNLGVIVSSCTGVLFGTKCGCYWTDLRKNLQLVLQLGRGRKRCFGMLLNQVYYGMRWLNLNTAKLRDHGNTNSKSAYSVNLTLETSSFKSCNRESPAKLECS